MIVLFTDFGGAGPYAGQIKTMLARLAPGVPVIDFMHDAPIFSPKRAAYLLAALIDELPPQTVILGVVDPGVGSGQCRPAVLQAGDRWFVGPDNGLFQIAARRLDHARWWEVTWRPERLSATFHGRDLFAPVAAMLAGGGAPPGVAFPAGDAAGANWPDDLGEVVYVDHYGNAMTGIRAATVPEDAVLSVRNVTIRAATTFADVAPGSAMWYRNSVGLVEIAVNRGRADQALGLEPGAEVLVTATA